MAFFGYKLIKQVAIDRNNQEVESSDIFAELGELPSNYVHATKKYEYVVIKSVFRKKIFDIFGVKKFDKTEYCVIVLNITFSDTDKYLMFHTKDLIAMESQIELHIFMEYIKDTYDNNFSREDEDKYITEEGE